MFEMSCVIELSSFKNITHIRHSRLDWYLPLIKKRCTGSRDNNKINIKELN